MPSNVEGGGELLFKEESAIVSARKMPKLLRSLLFPE